MLIFEIFLPQMCQQLNFSFGLHEKGFFGFDDFDGDFAMAFRVFCSHHLAKAAFADSFFDFIATIEHFTLSYYIVIVFIVPTVVVDSTMPTRRLCLFLLSSSTPRFPILVIDSIDVLVRVDQ